MISLPEKLNGTEPEYLESSFYFQNTILGEKSKVKIVCYHYCKK